MKNERKMLSSILKTTQMGQIGIRSVMDRAVAAELKKALADQLREYDSIESEAHGIAAQRGWELPELDPAVRAMADMMTRVRVPRKRPDSKIADLMIHGNTKGMVKSLRNLHSYPHRDAQVSTLSQKLLDCENSNIRQMQRFL